MVCHDLLQGSSQSRVNFSLTIAGDSLPSDTRSWSCITLLCCWAQISESTCNRGLGFVLVRKNPLEKPARWVSPPVSWTERLRWADPWSHRVKQHDWVTNTHPYTCIPLFVCQKHLAVTPYRSFLGSLFPHFPLFLLQATTIHLWTELLATTE